MTDGSAEQRQMRRKSIFVINRSPEFLDMIRELLQDERYNVTTTNYVPRTFNQIAALQPDLLIIDLSVGKEAGWNLLARLQYDASTRNIPIIVVSTQERYLEEAKAHRAIAQGARYLRKPFDIGDLLAAIHALIGRA